MIYTPVTLSTLEARCAVMALLEVVHGSDAGDCSTWHNDEGFDDCMPCRVIVKLRAVAAIASQDHLRP